MPGSDIGLRAEDPTIATALKSLGYATRQFGKNHFGYRDEFLPTAHGFDEFFGNTYHLNAEEEPELDDYPSEEDLPDFRKNFGPRGVIHLHFRTHVKDGSRGKAGRWRGTDEHERT
jgi:arylsulfatase A-like enzyme